LIDVNGVVSKGQLRFDWIYSKNIHRKETIENLAKGVIATLESYIQHSQSAEGPIYTPTDFPDVELSQEKLDDLLAEITLD
jgi:non-ribosomal peptide synthase protein (TIGR01720 family)